MDHRYTVAQAVKLTGVKSYVLRYWEEELNLRIGRNELGHRFYTGYDIQLFLNIKELKNRGLKLAAIGEMLPKLAQNAPGGTGSRLRLLEGAAEPLEEKAFAGEKIFAGGNASVKENVSAGTDVFAGEADPAGKSEEVCGEAMHEVSDGKILEFQEILERLIAQELNLKKSGEVRCRSLDAAIRRQQQARKQAAAASEKKSASGFGKGWKKPRRKVSV